VDIEGHGRDTSPLDVSRTVGWFTVAVPLVLELERDSVRRAVVAAQAALDTIPGVRGTFGVLRYLHPDSKVRAALARFGVAPVIVNYLSSVDGTRLDSGLLTTASESYGEPRSAEAPRAAVIEVNARLVDECLQIDVDAPAGLSTADGPVDFADVLRGAFEELADSAQAEGPRLELMGLDEAGMSRVAELLADLDAG
jgi:hypothetical protein